MSLSYADSAQKVIRHATMLAATLGQEPIEPAHIMAGLLTSLGQQVYAEMVSHAVDVCRATDPQGGVATVEPELRLRNGAVFSPASVAIFTDASQRAARHHAPAIDATLLTLSMLHADDPGVREVLHLHGLGIQQVLTMVTSKSALQVNHPKPEAADRRPATTEVSPLPKTLEPFVRDLTSSKLTGPVLGRELELQRLYVILGRRAKNNPVLVGEAGVGKTAIVEALASAISNGTAPDHLQGSRVLEVEMGSLLAGTRARGDLEQRIKVLLAFATSASERIILFIDEIHSVVGAGAAGGSTMGVSDLLKPLLARGGLRLIGATTHDEYRKHIQSDAALERRFSPVEVNEPDIATTVAILQTWRDELREHHHVNVSDAALKAAAELSDKWITGRQLPDKALDLVDEACARLAMARARGSQQEVVTDQDIAALVSQVTGVPVTTLAPPQATELLELRTRLATRVVGQDSAVDAVTRAVLRRRSGIDSLDRPASFLFAGPTGVGKTELAKALAEEMLGSEGGNALVTIDCSELDTPAAVAKLIGAPPGFVGYSEGGRLTEAIRRNRNAVILFDEADKADPRIYDILLQILDEGRLTDSQGQKVDCSATVIILTSNHGAGEASRATTGFSTPQSSANARTQVIMNAVKQAFRPELLNRLDKVVVFNELSADQAETIAAHAVLAVTELAAEAGVTLRVSARALTLVAAEGFDARYGARSLRRSVQELLTDPLADLILVGARGPVDVDWDGSGKVLQLTVATRALVEAAVS